MIWNFNRFINFIIESSSNKIFVSFINLIHEMIIKDWEFSSSSCVLTIIKNDSLMIEAATTRKVSADWIYVCFDFLILYFEMFRCMLNANSCLAISNLFKNCSSFMMNDSFNISLTENLFFFNSFRIKSSCFKTLNCINFCNFSVLFRRINEDCCRFDELWWAYDWKLFWMKFDIMMRKESSFSFSSYTFIFSISTYSWFFLFFWFVMCFILNLKTFMIFCFSFLMFAKVCKICFNFWTCRVCRFAVIIETNCFSSIERAQAIVLK